MSQISVGFDFKAFYVLSSVAYLIAYENKSKSMFCNFGGLIYTLAIWKRHVIAFGKYMRQRAAVKVKKKSFIMQIR